MGGSSFGSVEKKKKKNYFFIFKNLGKVVGLQRFELVVTKDLFQVWEGFLDEEMEVTLVVNIEANSLESYFRMAARTVRSS